MKKTRIRDICYLAIMILASLSAAGCSGTDKNLKWSNADTPPSGYVFSNGFPPSSEGPSPAWYAKRFGRVRGLGEAIKQYPRSLWDRDKGTWVYYIGGVLSAQYHPWEHYLQIRTDIKDENNTVCHWAEDGKLTITSDKGPAPAGGEETCKHLLDVLENHVAPHGIMASGS